MTDAKHTPGPWSVTRDVWPDVAEYEKHGIGVRPARPADLKRLDALKGWSSGYAPIALVKGDKRYCDDAMRLANARLIAAAPELLEALHILLANLSSDLECEGYDPLDDARVKLARDAIAKATGAV